MAGTVIAASLVTGLNSDLPGFVIAQVTEHVYDTVSGRFLLIPQGSRLVGKYDSIVAFGQERALVVWQRIILPDGSSIVIDNLPATDTGGYAGLADQVDLHTWKMLKGVALATVLGVGSELAFGSADNDLVKALQQSTQSTTNRAGQRLVERNLSVKLDDPALPQPIWGALLEGTDSAPARLVWRRDRKDDGCGQGKTEPTCN
jgi:type IV secretory pathway VirB10-like protein